MSISRILIVADARETVDELRDYFEENGFETEVALNSKVASAILEERKMDIAIVGFEVQDISGIEILKTLRSINRFIPVILIQGDNSKKTKLLAKKEGAQCYVPEPIDKEDFLQTVKKILASHPGKVGKKLPSK